MFHVVGIHGADLFTSRSAKNLDDLHQLVNARFTREEGLSQHQLGHYATGRPHIWRIDQSTACGLSGEEESRTDLRCVVGRAKDQLGRSVVARADVRNVGLVFDQDLRRSEIAQFENAGVGVQQEILRLDVTVTDPLRMDVGKRSEQLVDVELDLQHGHCGLQFVEIARCAVHRLWNVFEDEVEVHFIFLWSRRRTVSLGG